ncbi:MAG: MiaB/RimO family radical SAM methylthiotransferase [Endomicrobiales bacterium]|nr:MiaB/RimO family radical SAM methylthiotransferase [Endomicrobiales bacterium]
MKKLAVRTFGCKVNQYETRILSDELSKNGCVPCGEPDDADILLVNTCTVTAEAGRQARQLINRSLRKNPKLQVFVAGCWAKLEPEKLTSLSPRVKIFANTEQLLKKSPGISRFEGHSRAFVKIQDGCDAFCSYCIVPFARPKLWSRPKAEILAEIGRLAANGYPEIVLSGVRLGKCEGRLVPLLEEIAGIEGGFRVRLSSLELKEMNGALIDFCAENPGKICPYFHVPLQSASDRILKAMNRPYTSAEFADALVRIRQKLPDAGITTDVIVGFPGETEEDFRLTLDFVKKHEFSRLHVFRYSKRPGTKAADFPGEVRPEAAKRRSKILRELGGRLEEKFWRSFIGKIRPCTVEEGTGKLMTDNYITLGADTDASAFAGGITPARIYEKNSKPFGALYCSVPSKK